MLSLLPFGPAAQEGYAPPTPQKTKSIDSQRTDSREAAEFIPHLATILVKIHF
jgi:hypothetical protein